ncbi:MULTISPECIES: hypothetical protein [Actinomyces]|jgi:hypothetical protein|uniref:hypothetical protein n=1 Tax=Actinomyces TaxID=1654 RepID=UPI0011817A35|nr:MULTISPECIES: hypothetical protein [Actinomyces]QQQ59193.1 hypothetical protein JJJ14_12095 [Actinomyces sp. HMT 175]
MAIKYYGKRSLLGKVLAATLPNLSAIVIDLIGLNREEAIELPKNALRNSAALKAILLSVESAANSKNSLVRYYSELEKVARREFENNGLEVVTILAPAVMEELGPYVASQRKIFGSYPEAAMPWCSATDIALRIADENLYDTGEVIRIGHTVTATVEQVLRRIEGDSAIRYAYHHLPPDILADSYRRRKMDERDSQIADQLPYYQYYVGTISSRKEK